MGAEGGGLWVLLLAQGSNPHECQAPLSLSSAICHEKCVKMKRRVHENKKAVHPCGWYE